MTTLIPSGARKARHCKIVCTLGPATRGRENVRRLVEAGMDIARLNFSHADHETHRQALADVRQAALDLDRPIAVIGDLSGPKIRIGEIEGGEVPLAPGACLLLTTRPIVGDERIVSTNHEQLSHDVRPDMAIYIDDGLIELVVEDVLDQEVRCRVKAGGTLKSRKGLNIPRAELSLPALTPKDKADIEFGRQIGVDFFALSFVRSSEDVRAAKLLAGDIPVIAKIEKPQAIDDLAGIADVADGLMVARGDLGIEVGFEKVPLLQKRLIREMNARAKPVITATQMLESMVVAPQPTRAEVSDVANAVLDGTDAVMLSAESAAGKYPFEAASAMARIIDEVEDAPALADLVGPADRIGQPSLGRAIAHAAARMAIDLDLPAVVVFSETGKSAALVSAYRPQTAIVAFSRHESVVRRMGLLWGVTPVLGPWAEGVAEVIRRSEDELSRRALAAPGDSVAITFGLADGGPPGTTMLKLWRIGSAR